MPRRSQVDMGLAKTDVNLTTIANKLGISVSTVSRALRNSPGTHPLTRSRVQDIATSMGYRTVEKAVKVVAARNVLTLSQGQGTAGTELYMAGLSQASLALNLSLLSYHYAPDACEKVLDSRHQPPALRTGEVSGIVLMHRWPENVVIELAKRLPVVSIVHGYPLVGVDLVGVDDREGVLMLVRHLISKGHRHIGFFGYCRAMSWARSRYCAFLEAMAEQNIMVEPGDVIPISLESALSPSLVEMPDIIELVMKQVSSGVTAWVGSSEILAYSLCGALMARGLSIPKDVAVTGYHAQIYSVLGLPQLTSTKIVSQDLGVAALRRLVTRIDNPKETSRSILLPAQFIPGETT